MANKLDLAEAQLTGFNHGAHGFSIKSLIESMGLTKSEWIKIQDSAQSYLTEVEVEEINSYFKI